MNRCVKVKAIASTSLGEERRSRSQPNKIRLDSGDEII